ncbi:hypothetical protein GF312_18620 [Candidatus Poribacteria bacterium]|nr:hypothetical protein [Candidatus Poribacteria bacterium]
MLSKPVYSLEMLNLAAPGNEEVGQIEFNVKHRFYGTLHDQPSDTFFGLDSGANVSIEIGATVFKGLGIHAGRIRDSQEYLLGVNYSYPIPLTPMQTQLDVQYFNFKEFDLESGEEERKNGGAFILSLKSDPLFDRLTPVVDVGFESQEQKFGAGFGASIMVMEGNGLLQKLSIICEYFPTKSEDNRDNSFSFGLKAETYGHHFDFIFSRDSHITFHRLMNGSTINGGLRFGFNIKRYL